MIRRKSAVTFLGCVAFIGVSISALVSGAAIAAQFTGTPKRTPLQQFEVPGSNYITIVALTELEPFMTAERHIHPGAELTYVLEGGGEIFEEGHPSRKVGPGDNWRVEAGVPHYLKNGPQRTRLLVTYVLEKGKPLAIPSP